MTAAATRTVCAAHGSDAAQDFRRPGGTRCWQEAAGGARHHRRSGGSCAASTQGTFHAPPLCEQVPLSHAAPLIALPHRSPAQLLNVTDEEEPRPAAHKAAPPADQVDQVNAVYLALHQQGFDRPHIEAALTALPSLAGVDVAAALDWLLLHLEVAELPRQYIDNSRARGPVELRHKAAQPQAEDEAQTRERQRQEAEAAKAQAAERAAAEAAAAAARGVERRRAEEQEQTSRRAWILQYAEDGSSDESDMQSALDGGSSASGSVVEDWEVWGDPREMERRRAERRRQQLPLEQRLALIAEELHQAKQGGAAAKAAGDKDRQRTCGQVIG